MAIIRFKELKTMKEDERAAKLVELKQELMKERSKVASTGLADNPGRMSEIRRTIARIETIARADILARGKGG